MSDGKGMVGIRSAPSVTVVLLCATFLCEGPRRKIDFQECDDGEEGEGRALVTDFGCADDKSKNGVVDMAGPVCA